MADTTYLLAATGLMVVATFSTRALPFVFLKSRKDSPFLNYVGLYLPPAVMLLLVIYSLKDVEFMRAPFGAPEFISIVLVSVLHVWKRNALLSIGAGTGLYIFLIRTGLIDRLLNF